MSIKQLLEDISLMAGSNIMGTSLPFDDSAFTPVKVDFFDYQQFSYEEEQDKEQDIERDKEQDIELDKKLKECEFIKEKSLTGWFETASKVHIFDNASIELNFPILNAEFIINETINETNESDSANKRHNSITSVIIDYLGNYTWGMQVCTITPILVQDKKDGILNIEDATHIAETVKHKQVKSKDRFLVYKRLWSIDSEACDTPVVKQAFFVGFEQKKG